MTEKKEYPEEIYTEKMNVFGVWTCRLPDIADIEKAYDIGLSHGKEQAAQADPLAGFSNLTQAIQDGTRIDWEKLDGRAAKCVHPKLGCITYRLSRNNPYTIDTPAGWYIWNEHKSSTWVDALTQSWLGKQDWSLWVEGEIPVKPRTADELTVETRNALPHLLGHIDRLTRRLEIAEKRMAYIAKNYPLVHADVLEHAPEQEPKK